MENEQKPGLSESHRLKLRGVAITLGISVIFAFVFGLVLQSSTRVPALVTTAVFGLPFGTVLVLLQLSSPDQIRFRSFLGTTLYRTLLRAAVSRKLWLGVKTATITFGAMLHDITRPVLEPRGGVNQQTGNNGVINLQMRRHLERYGVLRRRAEHHRPHSVDMQRVRPHVPHQRGSRGAGFSAARVCVSAVG